MSKRTITLPTLAAASIAAILTTGAFAKGPIELRDVDGDGEVSDAEGAGFDEVREERHDESGRGHGRGGDRGGERGDRAG